MFSTVFLALALVAINLAGGLMFAADKRAAIAGRRRVPERMLLALAALGAAPVMLWLAARIRHKTRKQPFRAFLIAIFAAQIFASLTALAYFAGLL